jgi:hypothetical protein
MTTKAELIEEIKARLVCADRADERAKDWKRVLREEVGISKSQAQRCMAIASGDKTDEEVRAKNAEHNRRYRERQSRPSREGQDAVAATSPSPPPLVGRIATLVVDTARVEIALRLVAEMTLAERADFFDQLAAAYPHAAQVDDVGEEVPELEPEPDAPLPPPPPPAPGYADPGDIPECCRRAA